MLAAAIFARRAAPRPDPSAAQPGEAFAGESQREPARYGDMPGEFERHDAIVLCWPDRHANRNDLPHEAERNVAGRRTMLDIIQAIHRNVRIVLLVKSATERRDAQRALRSSAIPAGAVRILELPHDSVWIRDYGPLSVCGANGPRLIDKKLRTRTIRRDLDDRVSKLLAARLGLPAVEMPLLIEGGNLLSNGDGLLVTTTLTLVHNRHLGYDRARVDLLLHRYLGAKQVVYLEPLADEPTKHVDMFATFPARDTIVVGEYSPAQDPVNHAILERNVRKLRGVKTSRGPLNVVRVPMPPRGEDIFGGSYTNVVYANGVLLVPSYRPVDPAGLERAVGVYRRVLPGWKIKPVESRAWIIDEGSLHCVTLNVFRLPHEKPAK